jgi:hypothetical protein
MKTVIEPVAGGSCSLEAFAARHDLTISVRERARALGNLPRWIASFQHVEIMEGGMLRSASGNGETPEAAVADYARIIAGHRLVCNAYTSDRKEFQAPNEFTSIGRG